MAGPGGGPPRRTHTKSRNGCQTCKRRHIRCDENFPQCRNCTKHNCRCDYMDQPATLDDYTPSPQLPDLLSTPGIERELDSWRLTGEPPFPELRIVHQSYWHRFSRTDLRLIHHIAGLSIDLRQRGYSGCTVWVRQMPRLLAMALSCDFVLSAVLAFSASHLAWQTSNRETEHLAYQHRGVALKGLHDAIGRFSKESSGEILAASMLLSWQATEWESWISLQQGLSTVLDAMRPWIHESEIAGFIVSQRLFAGAQTPVTPNFPPSQPKAEDLARLDQTTTALRHLRSQISHSAVLADRISGLLAFLQELRRDFPLHGPEEAFERLQVLREWLFWLPPSLLGTEAPADLAPLAVLSHFFAAALALDPLFSGFGGSYLGSMAVSPIEEIHVMLLARRSTHPQDTYVDAALSLMDLPLQIVSNYKASQQVVAQSCASCSPSSLYPSYAGSLPRGVTSPPSSAYNMYTPTSAPDASHGSPHVPSRRSSYVTPSSSNSDRRRSSGYFEVVSKHSPDNLEHGGYIYGYSGPSASGAVAYSHPASGPPLSVSYSADPGYVNSTNGLWT